MTPRDEKTTREKLAVLLPHFLSHNSEHANELEKWAQRAENDGDDSIADELYHAAKHLKKSGKSLAAAESLLKGETPSDDDSDKCIFDGRHPGHGHHEHDHHEHGHHHD